MKLRILKSRDGFTLIEVMVSIIILSIGVLGLAPLMAVSITGNAFSNEATRANVIAQDRIEELAWRLGTKFETAVVEKKKELRVR